MHDPPRRDANRRRADGLNPVDSLQGGAQRADRTRRLTLVA